MPPMAYLLAKMLMAMLFSVLIASAIAIESLVFGTAADLTAAQWLGVVAHRRWSARCRSARWASSSARA